jgi:hypothetical protein
MRKVFLILMTGIFFCWVSMISAQSVIITENFDGNNGTFTSSPISAWKIDTNYYVSYPNSIRGIVPNRTGDTAVLVTQPYNFSSSSNILLRFKHICKVSPSDIIRIECRRNMGAGVMGNWEILPAESYLGDAKKNQLGMYEFNANTYSEWLAGDSLALPDQSWWKEELFDIGFFIAENDAVQFRFLIEHGSVPGTQISYGWLIDSIEFITASYELTPPFVEFIDPLIRNTVYSTGPYDINAKVKSRTSAQIENPSLIYIATHNGISDTDTLLMTPVSGDSLWKASIPQFIAGTAVSYSIMGVDGNGNTSSISSNYVVTIPNHAYGNNSVALTRITSPVKGQVVGETNVDVEVILHNVGNSDLTSATIDWTVNGLPQNPYQFQNDTLPWDFERTLKIGTYFSRKDKYDTVVVWVSMPNAMQDVYTDDDKKEVIIFAYSGVQTGIYTIGTGEAITTLAQAVTVLESNPPVRDITFAFKDGTYETNWNFSNISNYMGNYTLTITSLSGNKDNVILKPSSGVGITLNNSNNIRIEDITIDVNASGATNGILFTGSCTNVVINRCNVLGKVTGTSNTNSPVPIRRDGGTLVNITITNCYIQGGYYGGIYFNASGGVHSWNVRIDSNIISGQAYYAVNLYYVDLNSLSYNQISPRSSNYYSTWYATYLYNIPNGGKIIGNRIKADNPGLTGTNPSLRGLHLQYVDNALVANNEIILLNSKAATTYGLYASVGQNVDYLHNSVLITGTGYNSSSTFRAVYISGSSSCSNMTYQNNNFIAIGSSGGAPPYAVDLTEIPDASSSQYYYINSNNYYSSGKLARTSTIDRSTLSEWKAVVLTDINSVNKAPDFVDQANTLKLRDYTSLYCNPIPTVSKDIDNAMRNTPTVMGCYEDILENVNASLVEIQGLREGAKVGETDMLKVVFANNGVANLSSANLGYSINGVEKSVTHAFSPALTTLHSDTIFLETYNYTTAGNLDVKVWINSLNSGALTDGYLFNDTVSASFYICGDALTGIIPISDTSDFTTVTAAIQAISICGTGDITFVLDSGVYAESCNFSQINRYKPGNTLTLTSKTGKASDVVIKPASGAGIILEQTRNLTLKDITVDVSSGTSQGISFLSACTNIVVRDCRLLANPTTSSSTSCPVYKTTNTGQVDSIFFINNLIDGGYYGFCFNGGIRQALNAYGTNIVFDSNTLTNQYYAGAYIYYSDLISCSGNTVLSRTGTSGISVTWYGLYVRESNGPVIGNRVMQRSNSITQPSGIYCYQHNLIYANMSLQNRTLIANNEVIVNATTTNASVSSTGYGGIIAYQSRADILHNSVYVTGSGNSRGIFSDLSTNTANEIMTIKNNNVVMTSPLAYPLHLLGGIATYNADYNNLYAPNLVGYAGDGISSLEAWQELTQFDLHSVRTLPDFIDVTQNLKLSSSLYCDLLPDVATDIEGSTRMPSTTMGCYEQDVRTANGALVKIIGLQDGKSEGTNDNIYAVLLNAGTTSINSVNVKWAVNGVLQRDTTITYSAPLTAGQQDTLFLGELTYNPSINEVQVWINNLNGGALTDLYLKDDTIKTIAFACPNIQTDVITVSKTGTYKSITEVINFLSNCGFSSDITVVVESGIYEENITIPALNTTGNYSLTLTSMTGDPKDVTIRPVGGTAIALYTVSNISIRNITLDVQKGGRGIELNGSCSNIFIDSCNIFLDSTISNENYVGVYKKDAALNGLTVKNSIIRGGYRGIYLMGTSGDRCQNVTVDNNIIAAQIEYAVYTNYVSFNSLSYNQITSRSSNLGTSWTGLYVYYSNNSNIIGNRIRSNSGINSVSGFYIQYTTDVLVANNEVYLKSSGSGSNYGLYTYGLTRTKILHNTILIMGTSTSSTNRAAHIQLSSSYTGVYKNNIFANSASGGTPYAIALSTSPSSSYLQNHQIDYNHYYSSGNMGYGGSSSNIKADYAAWKALVTTDQNSTEATVLPPFIDLTTDMSLSNYAGLSCPYFSEVPQDIDGLSRVKITTMGAHTDSIPVFDLGIEQIVINTAIPYPQLAPVKIKVANVGRSVAINSATFGWSLNGEIKSSYSWNPSTALSTGADIEITVDSFSIEQEHVFDIKVWIESVNGVTDSAQWNDTASISVDVFWAGHNLKVLSIEPLVAAGVACPDQQVPLKIKVENTGSLNYDFAVNPVTFSIRSINIDPYVQDTTYYSPDTVFSSGGLKSKEIKTLELTSFFPIATAGTYDLEVFLKSSVEQINYDDTVEAFYVSGKFGLPIDADFSGGIPIAFTSDALIGSNKWEMVSKGTDADSVVVPQFGTDMIAFKGSQGSMTTLSTQPLDLSRTEEPSLSFWYFHDTIPCEDYTDVVIRIDGGDTYSTLLSLTKYDTLYGWKQYNVDLPHDAISECVILIFEAMEKSRGGDITQYIDRIRIIAKQDIAVKDILIQEYNVCTLEDREVKVVLSNLTDLVLNYANTLMIVTLEVQETGQIFTDTLRSGSLERFSSDTITLARDLDLGKGTYTFKAYFTSVFDVDRDNDTLVTSLTINPELKVVLNKISGNNCLPGELPIYQDVVLTNTGDMDLFDIDLILQIDTGETGSPAYFRFTERYADTIHVDSSFTYTFKNEYAVPWVSDYYPRIYAYLSCDSVLLNVTTAIQECVDMEDLYMVSIDNPSAGKDTIGAPVQVKATLRNRSDVSSFSNQDITVVVENSQGVETAKFTEIIAPIGILATVSHTFTSAYTVPNDSVYYLTVYIDHNDNYLSNDTLRIKRTTEGEGKDLELVGIDNPSSGKDVVGSTVRVSANLYNNSKYEDFTDLNITVLVKNSQGIKTVEFTEKTGTIGKLSTVNHTFTQTYTVPNDSVYYLQVYIDSYDDYPYNDTLNRTRYTENVGITSLGVGNSFTLGQNIPNPANNATRIDYSVPEAGEALFHVHSISGQLLYSQSIEVERGVHSLELNTSTFAAGVYFYSMEYKGQKLVKQLIIK